MAAFITVSFGERELKLKANSLTVANLSMIFRLESSGLYIHSQEGEIVLPDDEGMFSVDEPGTQKKYIVNGNPRAMHGPSLASTEPSSLSPQSTTVPALGIPLSYQNNERSRLNPPPHSSTGHKRP